MTTPMINRYTNFLSEIHKLCIEGQKVTPSTLVVKHKVSAYAIKAVFNTGMVKDMEPNKNGSRQMVWIPSMSPTKKDVEQVYTEAKRMDAEAKRISSNRDTLKKAASKEISSQPTSPHKTPVQEAISEPVVNINDLKKAIVTIGDTTIKIPVYQRQVEIVVNGTPITIKM